MSTASFTSRLGAKLAALGLIPALGLGTIGCGSLDMNTRDIMTMKQDLSGFIADQQSENHKIDASLSQIDAGLKDNNDIAKQSIDDVQKRIHEQMEEINKLRGEVEALRISLGKGGAASSSSGMGMNPGTAAPADMGTGGSPDLLSSPNGGPPPATAADSGAAAHLASGLNAYTIGNYDEAGKEFDAALASNPNADQTTELEYWLGEIQYNKQDYPKALAHYKKAIETNRSHEKAWASLEKWALIRIAQGQKDSGLQYFKYILANNPTYSNIDAVKARIKDLEGGAAKPDDGTFGLMPVAPGGAPKAAGTPRQ